MTRTLFTNVSILDCTGAEPYSGEVLVEDNRISTVAKGGGISRDGAEVVDGGGGTLMPGLIESHAHVTFLDTPSIEALGEVPPEEHTIRAIKNAETFMNQGFTSLCSAASAKPRLDVVLRNAISAGDIIGPRMLAASPELTVTGGLGDIRMQHMHRDTFAIVCDGAEQFRQVAREMCREGVDTLKINPSGDEFVPHARAHHTVMTEAEIEAVCEVGLSRDKRIASHCRSAKSVKLSLKHGATLIYHATLCDEEALDMLEEAKDRVFVAPTLGVTWTTMHEAEAWGITYELTERLGMPAEWDAAVANMKELHRRGVRVMPGGDYGFAWNPIGANARDIQYFVEHLGFTPMYSIMSATKLGGEIMMMGDELGQIQEGYLADILVVDGDPLKDVSILRDRERLRLIMKDGKAHKNELGHASADRVAAE